MCVFFQSSFCAPSSQMWPSFVSASGFTINTSNDATSCLSSLFYISINGNWTMWIQCNHRKEFQNFWRFISKVISLCVMIFEQNRDRVGNRNFRTNSIVWCLIMSILLDTFQNYFSMSLKSGWLKKILLLFEQFFDSLFNTSVLARFLCIVQYYK